MQVETTTWECGFQEKGVREIFDQYGCRRFVGEIRKNVGVLNPDAEVTWNSRRRVLKVSNTPMKRKSYEELRELVAEAFSATFNIRAYVHP